MIVSPFERDPNKTGAALVQALFEWLTSASTIAEREPGPTVLMRTVSDPLWQSLVSVAQLALNEPVSPSHALRHAFGNCVAVFSRRSQSHKFELELSSLATSVAESRKQPIEARQFALSILESIVLLPKDGISLIARNSFPILVTLFNAAGSSSTQKSPGYKLSLVRALLAVRKVADAAMLSESDLKLAWKLVLGAVSEPSVPIAVSCWQLLAELASPELLGSHSKLEKLVSLYDKYAASNPSYALRDAASKALAGVVAKFEKLANAATQLQLALEQAQNGGSSGPLADRDNNNEYSGKSRSKASGAATSGSSSLSASGSSGSSAAASSAAAAAAASSSSGSAHAASAALKIKVSTLSFLQSRCSLYTNPTTSARQAQSLALLFEYCLLNLEEHALTDQSLPQLLEVLLVLPNSRLTRWRYAAAKAHVQRLVCIVLLQHKLATDKARLALLDWLIVRLETAEKNSTKSTEMALPALLPVITGGLNWLGPATSSQKLDHLAKVLHSILESAGEPDIRADAAQALIELVSVSPRHLLPSLYDALDRTVQCRDLLSARLCAALLAEADKNVLYSAADGPYKVLNAALSLLRAGKSEIAAMECGWELVSGIVSLNAQSVRALMPQLLVLWSTANTDSRTLEGFSAALAALHTLLSLHSSLVTADVSRSAATTADEAWKLCEASLASSASSRQVAQVEFHAIRVYTVLASHIDTDGFPASLLTHATSVLTGASKLAQTCDYGLNGRAWNVRQVKHAAQNESLRAESAVDAADNIGFGISRLVANYVVSNSAESDLQLLHRSPFEWDLKDKDFLLPTALIDASLDLLIKALPAQQPRIQESLLDRVRIYCEDQASSTDASAEAALLNVGWLLSQLLKNTMGERALAHERTAKAVESLAIPLLKSKFEEVRKLGAQALGLLAVHCPSRSSQLATHTLDSAIAERLPEARAGYTAALGAVLNAGTPQAAKQVPHAATILVQFAQDPSPVVHRAAYQALDGVVAAAGMRAHGFARLLVSTLSQVCVYESHSSAASLLAAANLLTTAVGILGPELATDDKLFAKVAALAQLFSEEKDDDECVAAGWLCWQELLFFARDSVDVVRVVSAWAAEISNITRGPNKTRKRDAAIKGVSTLFSLTSSRILTILGSDFERTLWAAFDADPNNQSLKELLRTWLEQTAAREPERWIMRLSALVMRPKYVFETAFSSKDAPVTTAEADEGESLGVHGEEARTELLSWNTRQFATEQLLVLVRQELRDQTMATRQRSAVVRYLGDIVRIAFSAATSSILVMELAGLELLDELMNELADLPDPEFPETKLLSQFQAQISPALTPAFAADSSPLLALAALKVSASYIGSGVVKKADKFGRMLKIVSASAVSAASGDKDFTIGQVELSDNGRQVLRVGVLRLWAELAAKMRLPHREYLRLLVEPYLETLIPQWDHVLCVYARLRYAPAASTTRTLAESLDALTHAETQHALLPVYNGAWLDFVTALADTNTSKTLAKVLFGLCFEQLLQATAGNERKAAIKALAAIIKVPAVAEEAAEPLVRRELVLALSRVILTGEAVEQTSVISAVCSICCKCNLSAFDEQFLGQCVHLCATPLIQRLHKIGEHVWSGTELELAAKSLSCLVKIAQSLDATHKLYSDAVCFCVIKIFEELTNSPTAQEVLLPHVFASFRDVIVLLGSARPDSSKADAQLAVSRFFARSVAVLTSATEVNAQRNRALECMVVLVSAAPLLASRQLRASVTAFGEWVGSRIETSDKGLSAVLHECVRAVFASAPLASLDPASVAFVTGALPALCGRLASSKLQGTAADTPKLVCNVAVRWATLNKSGPEAEGAVSVAATSVAFVSTMNWLSDAQRTLYSQTLLMTLAKVHPEAFGAWFRTQSLEEQQRLRAILEHEDDQDEPEETIKLAQL